MKKLLITGFDPFGSASINPSWLAVQALPDQIGDYSLRKLGIPTVFGKATRQVLAEATVCKPDAILCVGLAAGRDAVTPERIAVNIRDTRIPDNAGNQPKGEFVVPEGPAAYFSTLPVEKMAQAIRDAGIPSTVSNSAGAFVCNDTLYSLLHHFSETPVRVGFVHVPQLLSQGTPGLTLEEITRALTAAILSL